MQRVAATQAKVARRAAQEKKARAIADVWAAIAERKRNREQEGGQTKEAEPKATQRRQDDGTERPVADAQDGIAAGKRQRDVDKAERQEAERRAKQRKDGTDEAREGQTDLQVEEKEGAKPSDKATVPAKEGKATQKRNLCEYVCPHCSEAVTSTVRTGQVNHRRRCGNRFRVKDARVMAKGYVYLCPFCNGEILSDTKTGQINHRSVCGNQFYVKEGCVSRVAKAHVYMCPFCNGEIRSNTETGQINHRSVCGNQFYVKEGHVSRETRRHAHSCPVCETVVWSSRSFGTRPLGNHARK